MAEGQDRLLPKKAHSTFLLYLCLTRYCTDDIWKTNSITFFRHYKSQVDFNLNRAPVGLTIKIHPIQFRFHADQKKAVIGSQSLSANHKAGNCFLLLSDESTLDGQSNPDFEFKKPDKPDPALVIR